MDHLKETGVLLLLKPIHVSDAFPVRNKCKLFVRYSMCIFMAHEAISKIYPSTCESLVLCVINLVGISLENTCLGLFPP